LLCKDQPGSDSGRYYFGKVQSLDDGIEFVTVSHREIYSLLLPPSATSRIHPTQSARIAIAAM